MQKQQVFYIHGGSSYSNYDDYLSDLRKQPLQSAPDEEIVQKWPHSLRTQLGESYQVLMPQMPNKQNARYEEWKIWFERHFEFLDKEVIFVCWSLGGVFMTKYLSENSVPFTISKLFLLAAPFDYFVSDDCKEDGGDFYPEVTRVPDIGNAVDNIYILHSKDDFVVPYEHALKYQEALPQASLVTFEDKNHFLVEELPELVDLIKKV